MQAFARVAELGSFTRAADELALSRAMVSTHVRRLERRFGVKLLNRTTRKVAVTPAGADYLGNCRRVFAELAEAQETLRRGREQPTGSLRIDVRLFRPAHPPSGAARIPRALSRHRSRTALQRAHCRPRQGRASTLPCAAARSPTRTSSPGPSPDRAGFCVAGVYLARRPAPVRRRSRPARARRIHHRRYREARPWLFRTGHAAPSSNSGSRSTRWKPSCWRGNGAGIARPWTSWRAGARAGRVADHPARLHPARPVLSVVYARGAAPRAGACLSDFLRDLIREVSRRARSATGHAADPA